MRPGFVYLSDDIKNKKKYYIVERRGTEVNILVCFYRINTVRSKSRTKKIYSYPYLFYDSRTRGDRMTFISHMEYMGSETFSDETTEKESRRQNHWIMRRDTKTFKK